MKNAARMMAAGLFACLGAGMAGAGDLPAAAVFYPLVGSWSGQGQLAGPDGRSVDLVLELDCDKAAGGVAVRCDLKARGDGVEINESDLMGVDPATGQAHWYAVSDQGEAHDHHVEWTDASDMRAGYSWNESGAGMVETIVLQFAAANALSFTTVVTADGTEIARFAGKLTR